MNKLYYTPITKDNPGPEIITDASTWSSISEEFYVILIDPFVKHYAGTIFDLGPALPSKEYHKISNDSNKISSSDYLVFHLPDAGLGTEAEIPKYMTWPITKTKLKSWNLKNGPCRITSMRWQQASFSSAYKNDYPIPDGYGPLHLSKSEEEIKNTFTIDLLQTDKTQEVRITDKITQEVIQQISQDEDPFTLSGQHLNPGFYDLQINIQGSIILMATFIKLFPVYLQKINDKEYKLMPTIW